MINKYSNIPTEKLTKNFKLLDYTEYTCECGKPAAPKTEANRRKKDNVLTPLIGKDSKTPVCYGCHKRQTYSNKPGGVNAHTKAYNEKNKIKNWEILCDIFYGEFVGFKERTCLYSAEKIYAPKLSGDGYSNISELHHMFVEKRASKMKSKKEPSTILFKPSLSKDDIIEFIGIIPLTASWHKYIHAHSPSLDYRMFKRSQLPFAMRNEENFNFICSKYEINLNYAVFMKQHINENMPFELVQSDWKN